jgi:glycosyltransferase involved in cell wall biosynthesis
VRKIGSPGGGWSVSSWVTGVIFPLSIAPSAFPIFISMPAILLAIPCYRERERLPSFLPGLAETLAESGLPVMIRAVDDGSGEAERAWLAEYTEEQGRRFGNVEAAQLNPVNLGKGGAVYSAWDRPGAAEVLAFVDADGAVPPREVVRVLREAAGHPGEAVFAVRTGEAGTTVRRDLRRKVAGQVFRWIVRWHFRFPLPDTQCGCKAVPASAFAAFRPQLTEMRFSFDIELAWHLLRGGSPIRCLPIDWTESPGSRLQPGSALAMYRSVRRLRKRLGPWQP